MKLTTTATAALAAMFVAACSSSTGSTAAHIAPEKSAPPASTHRAVTLAFGLAPGAGACTVTGYPGVDSGAGGPLVHADHLPRGYMGGLPEGVDEPPTMTLTPSVSADAVVESLAVDKSGDQCPTYTDLRVTPPDATQTSTVATTIEACVLLVHPVT
ncbi:MAG: hypothetical protein QOC76_5693 [Mycobacterium sp.]|jgi:hypothetical protein|nr:hypothetical protein [Mycobacterium sp.]